MFVACTAVPASGEESSARPGDEALSCDQIYDEGMSIVRKEQQQRDATRSRMETQAKESAALGTAAMTVGQVDPTHASAIAADAAVKREIRSGAELGSQAGAAKPDARKERLRTLWTQKHCTKN
jgi:hypothetical protein